MGFDIFINFVFFQCFFLRAWHGVIVAKMFNFFPKKLTCPCRILCDNTFQIGMLIQTQKNEQHNPKHDIASWRLSCPMHAKRETCTNKQRKKNKKAFKLSYSGQRRLLCCHQEWQRRRINCYILPRVVDIII